VTDPITGRRSRRTIAGATATETRAKLDRLRAVAIPSTTIAAAWLPSARLRAAPSTFGG
jgi:hypothetical protein